MAEAYKNLFSTLTGDNPDALSAPPSTSEILLRTLGGSFPQGSIRVRPTVGGRIAGTAGRLGATLSEVLGNEMQGRRTDPFSLELAKRTKLAGMLGLPENQVPGGPTAPAEIPGPPGAMPGPITESDLGSRDMGTGEWRVQPDKVGAGAPPSTLPAALTAPGASPMAGPVQSQLPRTQRGLAAGLMLGFSPEMFGYQTPQQAQTFEKGGLQLGEEKRTLGANTEFRKRIADFKAQNPNASTADVARFSTGAIGELGPSSEATSPYLSGITLQEHVRHNAAEEARLVDSINRGDKNAIRQTAATLLTSYHASLQAALKVASDYTNPQDQPAGMAMAKEIYKKSVEVEGQLKDILNAKVEKEKERLGIPSPPSVSKGPRAESKTRNSTMGAGTPQERAKKFMDQYGVPHN